MAETTEVHALVIDASGAAKGAAQAEAAAKKVEAANSGLEAATKRVADTMRGQERFLDSLTRKYDPAAAAAAKLAKEQARLEGIIAGGGANSERAAQALAMLQTRHTALGTAAERSGSSTGRFGMIAQQAGYQIADVANQVGNGTNAFIALGQQMGQLAGVFGVTGAVVGAVISIAGPLAAKLLDGESATKKAAKATDEYAEALEGANELILTSIDLEKRKTEAQRASAVGSMESQLAQAKVDLEQAREATRLASKRVERNENGFVFGDNIGAATTALREAEGAAAKAGQRVVELGAAVHDLKAPPGGSKLWASQNSDKLRVGEEIAAQIEERDKRIADSAKEAAEAREEAERLTTAAEEAAWEHRRALMNEEDKEREKRAEGTEKLSDYVAGLERETALLVVSATERERVNATLQAENIAKQHGIELSEEDRARIDATFEAKQRVIDADKQHKAVTEELGRFGERAFDRIGSAMTTMAMQGNNAFASLRNIGLAVISELMQEFVKLAAINPLKNAIFGGSAMTMGDALSNWFGPGAQAGPGAYQSFGTVDTSGISGPGVVTGNTGGFGGVEYAFAGGTDYAPSGLALVGEQGPELVQLGGGERIYTADQTSRLVGASNSNSVHLAEGAIVVNAPGATHEDAAAIAEQVAVRVVQLAAPQIQRGAVQQSLGAVRDAANRGGSFAQAVGRR